MIAPFTEDRETGPFFAAAAKGELVYRACHACGRGLHPPTAHCPYCNSWDTGWRQAKGTGRVHSWTVVKHQVHPALPAPYTLVLVELEDAPDVRLVGRLDGEAAVHPGMRMQVWFEPIGEGAALPQWRAAPES